MAFKRASNKSPTYRFSRAMREKYKPFIIESWNTHQIPEICMDRLIEEYKNWAYDEQEAICYTEYLCLKEIPMRTFQRWVNKYPKLEHAHELVKQVLGLKRQMGMSNFKYHYGSTAFTMVHYSPLWKEAAIFHADLNKKNDDDNVTVVYQAIKSKAHDREE